MPEPAPPMEFLRQLFRGERICNSFVFQKTLLEVANGACSVLRHNSLISSMKFSLIVTHPGSSHKDEFLACCVLLSVNPAPIERREPTEADLEDPTVAVVDVGGEHRPEIGNFDHHQFPRDHEPLCSLSLVLQYLDLYNDARLFCDWLEPAEWFDTRGPQETSRWLGISRDTLAKVNSPVDVTLLRRFANCERLNKGSTLWEIMHWIGDDIVAYVRGLRQRMDFIENIGQFWKVETGGESFRVFYLPRTDPLPDEPSSGIGRFIQGHPKGDEVVGLVYPDRRGKGFGLSRHNDHPRLDFTRVEFCDDVHFAHARGFVAKTSATDPERLRELLRMSWISE